MNYLEDDIMINKSYADYAWEQAAALLAIDSPSGPGST